MSEPIELTSALALLRADRDSGQRLLETDLEKLGATAKTELDALVSSPAWDQLPTYAQRRMIRDTFADWRDMAEETMVSRYPDLVRAKTERQLEELRR